ncbi:MAG: hypothetical protein IPM16_06675 [Chloroflexi bacterium]|nr:hypothetical protein [Chloroflexota bacterium]
MSKPDPRQPKPNSETNDKPKSPTIRRDAEREKPLIDPRIQPGGTTSRKGGIIIRESDDEKRKGK